MNWKFWQKTAAPPPRRFDIPADKVLEIKRLHDAHNALPRGQDNESHFRLWDAIGDIVPETKQGAWTIEHPTATTALAV